MSILYRNVRFVLKTKNPDGHYNLSSLPMGARSKIFNWGNVIESVICITTQVIVVLFTGTGQLVHENYFQTSTVKIVDIINYQ